jgi:hypothetical protein
MIVRASTTYIVLRLAHSNIHIPNRMAERQLDRVSEPNAPLLGLCDVLEDAAGPCGHVVDQKVDMWKRIHVWLAILKLLDLGIQLVQQIRPVFYVSQIGVVVLLVGVFEEDLERAFDEVCFNVRQDLGVVYGCLLLVKLFPHAISAGCQTVNFESQPSREGREMIKLIHYDDENLVTDKTETADDISDPVDLHHGKANVVAVVVKLSKPLKSAQNDGTPVQSWQKVLVY